jgi:dsRNA-specific ribonuclease
MASRQANTVDWSNNINLLREKLNSTIGVTLRPEDAAIIFDEQSMMNYWVPAFTHRSVDNDENYELLEAYGDTVLDMCLAVYARKTFGDENLSEAILNDLKDQYMSEDFQSAMFHGLGLGDYIRMDKALQLNKKMEEDVFESMFGALNNVVDDRIQFGLGYTYCFNLFRHLFTNVQINLSTVKKNEITQLKELLEALYQPEPDYKFEAVDDRSKGKVKIVVRDKAGTKIGEGYGEENKQAKLNAAKSALTHIYNTMGLTLELAQKRKFQDEAKNQPELARQITRLEGALTLLNQRAQRENRQMIVDYKIQKVTGTAKSKYGATQTTFSIEVAFKQPDGKLLWKSLKVKTGRDPNLTRIELAKEFSDEIYRAFGVKG